MNAMETALVAANNQIKLSTTDENVLLYDGDERDKKMMITEVQDNRDKEYETYL